MTRAEQEEIQQTLTLDLERQMYQDLDALVREHPEVPLDVLKLAWADGAKWGYNRGALEQARFAERQAATTRRRVEADLS